eukprot:scaffold116596_cov30-Tisochrysis_lutea.AAC.3
MEYDTLMGGNNRLQASSWQHTRSAIFPLGYQACRMGQRPLPPWGQPRCSGSGAQDRVALMGTISTHILKRIRTPPPH